MPDPVLSLGLSAKASRKTDIIVNTQMTCDFFKARVLLTSVLLLHIEMTLRDVHLLSHNNALRNHENTNNGCEVTREINPFRFLAGL